MPEFTKFQSVAAALANGEHNLGTAILKIALTNVAPNPATATRLSNITQIAATGGYVAGGRVVANSSIVSAGGIATLDGDDVVFTATGEMGPARYAVLYNDTAPNKPLLGYWDRGVSATLQENDTLTIVFGIAILSLS